MRQVILTLLLISALIFCMFPTNIMGQRVFVYGKITSGSGAPAMGVEVRLARDGVTKATAYTNQAGKYGFFDIEGNPSQYHLVIPRLGRNVSLQNIPSGGQVPDIVM